MTMYNPSRFAVKDLDTSFELMDRNPFPKEIITDPDPANARAIRAYEKAGFSQTGEIVTPGGVALLMTKERPK